VRTNLISSKGLSSDHLQHALKCYESQGLGGLRRGDGHFVNDVQDARAAFELLDKVSTP
jgi:hypothetical protein